SGENQCCEQGSGEDASGRHAATLRRGGSAACPKFRRMHPEISEHGDGLVITLGIDLASQPRNTASCAIAWQETRAQVTSLCLDVDDAALVAAMRGAAKVAIDAPLGWPVEFVAGLRDPGAWPVPLGESRSRLERRATGRWVHT